MKYQTKISRRKVVQAFDCWMQRRAALASPSPIAKKSTPVRPRAKPASIPPAPPLTMKAIAARCELSYATLVRLIDTDFRVCEFKRPKLVAFAKRHYRP